MMQSIEGVEHRVVSIYDLIPHERNYNRHPQKQLEELKASLRRFGQVEDIVVRVSPKNKYKIVAHEGVTTAALQLLEAGECLQLEQCGITVVPDSWTEVDVLGYMATSNLTPRKSEPDQQSLLELLQEQKDAGFDLASLGTNETELQQMLESLGDAYIGGSERNEAEDELPEEVETRARLGDVWALGRHKIACLDSTDAEQVKRFIGDAAVSFVWSDPPYGIDIVLASGYVGGGEEYTIPFGGVKNRTREEARSERIKASKYAPVIGDETTDTAITSAHLCLKTFPDAVHIWWGANYYAHALSPSSCWIVWDKETNGNFADAELAWCNDKTAVRIFKHMWNGMLKDSEKGQRRVHPTQKPIALASWCFEKYGKEHDIIYDPFLGSGMSIIAAENLNRTVYGCELSPEYIDVIIARYEAHAGQTATLLERAPEAEHA
jgi:DNA methylase/ParB/Sulfiredoxin domain